ncbi:MAG: putative protein-disulfide isomerase [Porticoccus sp.]|jgi:putative protein-disulfide isomerase
MKTTEPLTKSAEQTTLYYIYDPMCSWCWGFRPTWNAIQAGLPQGVAVEYVAAGLAPDSEQPMPQAMCETIEGYWHEIERQLGTEFNYEFWRLNTPRRSTYNSCRAAIAAKLQGREQAMVNAIQQAYYLRAMNPSDISMLVGLAQELAENDDDFTADQFKQDLTSIEVAQEFNRQRDFAQQISSQGYPSLVLKYQHVHYPIVRDYLNADAALNDIKQLLN